MPRSNAAARTASVQAAALVLVQSARVSGWSDEQVLTAVRGALLAPLLPRQQVSR